MFGRVFERAADFGRPGNGLAVLRESLHRAERKAQREGCVGIGVAAAGLELCVGDLRVRLPEHLGDVVVILLAQLARADVDHPSNLDHRIVRGIDRCFAAFAKRLAGRNITQLRTADQFRGAFLRRLAGQDLLHERTVRRHFEQVRKRVGERDGFEVLVDRRLGVESLLQRWKVGLAILA